MVSAIAPTYFNIKETPLDPIVGLDQLFREDKSPHKANLVVGVYQDEEGQSPVLSAVKSAEAKLLETEESKSYLPVPGEDDFRSLTENLVFGDGHPVIYDDRVSSMQTPGGTGALRLSAEFILDHRPEATIWISDPAYPNHPGIFGKVGLKTEIYPYYDLDGSGVTFDAMMKVLKTAKPNDVLLLHACCHNPSGADMSVDQWRQIGALTRDNGLFPLVDFAYLGFARGLEEDTAGLREFFRHAPCGLLAVSYSKNFAIYGERTGLLAFVGLNTEHASACASRSRTYARTMWSSPPAHGARIVSTVLSDQGLRTKWESEVKDMRDRISAMRELLFEELQKLQVDLSMFPNLLENHGMFALTRLTKNHVGELRKNHHVYMLENGRISIAGINHKNAASIAKAFAEVLRT